ncbi:MAG: lysylphosphatidylglycerol synthase transmembrane domain-containing protein [Candidatus Aenigmarchaeota archaeon]|nr:flippase-like domain-containing protein [Candidatus Aenigmarchaeota archaeon]MDW8149648.1 lysylphosphatidylglycerol synthase transmembrane domain-containing protein [Candidatus Aenigmarchaeota archaeon]
MNLKVLSIFVGIILLVLILYFSGFEEVISTILNSNPTFIFLALLAFIFSVFLKSLRWSIFLKSIKINVPFSHAFYSFNSAMFLGNLVPFKALEPIRGYFLKVKFGYSFSKTIPLVLTERALDVFVYILFSLITLQALVNFLPSHITFFAFLGMLIFFLISLSVLLILNSKKLTLKFFKFLSKLPIIKRFRKKVEKIAVNFSLGFNQLKRSKLHFQILFFTFLIWITEGTIFLLSAKAVSLNLPFSLFALPLLSILLGVLTLIPGGLGSIEAIMVLLLSSLGFPIPQATSAVLIYRFFVHLCENSIGAIIITQVYSFDIVKKMIKI